MTQRVIYMVVSSCEEYCKRNIDLDMSLQMYIDLNKARLNKHDSTVVTA